jgi:hypothetical protein
MGRLQSFLFGLVLGGAAMFGALQYHVVRAEDGLHFIPKVAPGLQDVYVDIRHFGVEDWDRHRSLAMSLLHANKSDLMKDSATGYLRDSLDNALKAFRGSP